MAKTSGGCGVTTIRFKTKRGKTVTFKGREGGSTAHGGVCKPKTITSGQREQRREFASASRACFKKLGKKAVGTKKFGACMKQAMA